MDEKQWLACLDHEFGNKLRFLDEKLNDLKALHLKEMNELRDQNGKLKSELTFLNLQLDGCKSQLESIKVEQVQQSENEKNLMLRSSFSEYVQLNQLIVTKLQQSDTELRDELSELHQKLGKLENELANLKQSQIKKDSIDSMADSFSVTLKAVEKRIREDMSLCLDKTDHVQNEWKDKLGKLSGDVHQNTSDFKELRKTWLDHLAGLHRFIESIKAEKHESSKQLSESVNHKLADMRKLCDGFKEELRKLEEKTVAAIARKQESSKVDDFIAQVRFNAEQIAKLNEKVGR